MTRWGGIFDIEKKLTKIAELESTTHAPEFWSDPKKAEQVLKQIKGLKSWTEAFATMQKSVDDLMVIYDFFKEEGATEQEVEIQYKDAMKHIQELEFRNMLGAQEDHLDAVMEINGPA